MSWRYVITAGSVQRWRKTSRIVDRLRRLSVKAARVPSSSRSRTHWGSNAVQVGAGRVPSGHNKLNDGEFCIMTDHLTRLPSLPGGMRRMPPTTAKGLGLTMPPVVLCQADEILQ